MTQVLNPPAPPVPVAPQSGPGAAAPGPGERAQLLSKAAVSASTVLAVMLLIFVAEMVLVGPVKHARAQNLLYQEFRSQLASAEAPTGQIGADGKPVPIGAPVAQIGIPSIGVKEVVAQGTTSGVLKDGPGHRRDTVMPGQAGTSLIFGRQATYGGPFKRIEDLRSGDEIAVRTGQGDALFLVTGIRHSGEQAPPPSATEARLTLMTAYGIPFLPSDAVQVDALLKEWCVGEEPDRVCSTSPMPGSAGPATADSLTSSETAMASDKSGLLGLLLWSQLLLLIAVVLAWVRAVWGRWQSWLVCVPILGFVGFQVAGLAARLLPNLM